MAGILNTTQGLNGVLSTEQTLNGVITVPPEREISEYSGDYTVTPSESTQTLATSGKKATSDITVNPIPSEYIVPSGSQTIITDGTYDVTEYASAVVEVGSPPIQSKSVSYTPTESAQSAEITPDNGYFGLEKVDISVGAISSDYVGSNIARRDGDDLTASGDTVTAPAGYYENSASKAVASGKVIPASSITAEGATLSTGADYIALNRKCTNTPTVSPAGYVSSGTSGKTDITLKASATIDPTPTASGDTVTIPSGFYTASTTKSVASGTEGTPTATKGTVSSNSVTVTPSVTNSAGYIAGGTHTGTAVTVSASELVSGTYTVDSSGTKDVTNYASASVPAGNRGNSTVYVNTTSTKKQYTVKHDNATSGFYDANSLKTDGVVEFTRQQETITPTTSTQTATPTNATYYLDSVTVNPIPPQYIIPSGTKSITANDTYDVTQYASAVVNVSGGGSPTLQTKTATYTPTTSQQTAAITADAGYDGLEEVDITVNAVPVAEFGLIAQETGFFTESGERKWRTRSFATADPSEGGTEGWLDDGYYYGSYWVRPAVEATSITPTESSQTIGGSQYMMEGALTVNAIPSNYVGSGITQRSSSDLTASGATVTAPAGYYGSSASKTIASGTEGTPTATKGAVSNHSISVTPSVTNTAGYISGSTKTGTAVSVTASELVSGTYTVDSSGAKDVTNYASASVPSGTAGTPTATKGTVSNHSVSVTPSVTNQTGYITGGTINGTAVTVTASELASGNKSITENGTDIDVVGYSTVSVSVSGGGGSSVTLDSAEVGVESSSSSITFTGLSGEPTSFVIYPDSDKSTASPANVVFVVYDGTSLHGQTATTTSNANASYDTGFTKSYSNGSLTVTATTAKFADDYWYMDYTYGGTAACIDTIDQDVGSGATSITFTGLEDEPIYWSCIFKSNFGTSSGYQRVMAVRNNGNNHYGACMDSSVHLNSQYWTSSYNNGSLTITSQGTNQGGYFHQPGYYQLTYVLEGASPYEKKSVTYRASTSDQTDKIEPSSGYDAMSEVNISIPAVSQTNLTAGNIKSGTTVTISNGQSNLWSVTGTYSGGGSSKNAQSNQTTTRSTSTAATSLNSLTCSTAGTYDVYWTCTRSSTSGTWSSQLYLGGTAYGTAQTSGWSNHVQTVKLTGVSISASQTVAVYGISRGSNYYIYCPQLTIIQTS